ncbi:MAG: hypothetical protein RL571_1654 [Pseudomonadota bacterium]|jgi:uncharacterized Zn-binding protein involved in type VI secretion
MDLDMSLVPEHCRSEIQALLDERARVEALPIKACYAGATVGSRTARGGVVKENGFDFLLNGCSIARTGDLVEYPDGSVATIISGAGVACSFGDGSTHALVGSHLSNGDIITDSLHYGIRFFLREGDDVEGFLVPHYKSPVL